MTQSKNFTFFSPWGWGWGVRSPSAALAGLFKSEEEWKALQGKYKLMPSKTTRHTLCMRTDIVSYKGCQWCVRKKKWACLHSPVLLGNDYYIDSFLPGLEWLKRRVLLLEPAGLGVGCRTFLLSGQRILSVKDMQNWGERGWSQLHSLPCGSSSIPRSRKPIWGFANTWVLGIRTWNVGKAMIKIGIAIHRTQTISSVVLCSEAIQQKWCVSTLRRFI